MARQPRSAKSKRKVFAGRYAYVKPLGRGAGGAVYLAEDLRSDDRLVALKVLSAEAVATVQGKMLRREFEILSKLDHPNLVRVYDYGSLPDGGVFLAEEYIDGFSLQDARALLEPAALIDSTLQLLQGLSYVHGMGMIHRDIKPANVMLLWLDDANAARPMVKLVDFGLSSADPKRDTLRGGTRSYMAPEIIRGEKGEFRSDLYSLGVTLYYAMCGVLPFGPRSKEDPPPTEEDFRPPEPHRLNPEVPLALSRFTMVLLRQVPSIEYADAGEALQGLADDTESLEWIATGHLANSLDIAAPPVLRGYFERGILLRQDAQRDMLVEELQAATGSGQMHLVRGPVGVGKSRLIREVAASMKLGRRIVVQYVCEGKMQPFQLLLELLRQLVEIADSRGMRIGDRVQPSIHMLERLAPWVGHAKSAQERASDFQWIREAFQDVVVMLHPDRLVLFVEDMHLADDDSIAMLARWYDDRKGRHRPDMVVSACPGFATDELGVIADVEVVEGEGLRPEDVEYFFRKRLGEKRVPDDWIRQVAAASRANPAYVEELSRHLIDAGILSRSSSISWDIKLQRLLAFPLPKGQQESLRRRLSALGNLGREALEVMALIGHRVEWATLRKLLVAGGETAADAERTMELLRWRHFVNLELDTSGRYLHLIDPELGDVVVSQINPEWKRSLHRRIGERLRKSWFTGAAPAAEAAQHLQLGGNEEDGRVLWEVAGDLALRESEFAEAAEAFRQAISMHPVGQSAILLRVKLAESLAKIHEIEPSLEALEEAWKSAERTALDWLTHRVCMAGVDVLLTLGRPEGAREWFDRLRDFLPVHADEPEVLAYEARFYAMRGQIERARDASSRSLARDQHFGNRDGAVRAMALLGRLELWSGRPDHAVSHFTDAVALGEMNESWEPLGMALCGLGEFQRWQGDYPTSLETLQKAFEIASAHGNLDLWIEVLLEMAETYLASGDLEAASRRIVEGARLADDLEHKLWSARADFMAGQIAFRRTQHATALTNMETAADRIGQSTFAFPFGVSVIERLGHCLNEAGRDTEGNAKLAQARKLASEYGLVARDA